MPVSLRNIEDNQCKFYFSKIYLTWLIPVSSTIYFSHNVILAMSWCLYVQSDLGYPATSGPAHIRISDLAGYERYAWTQQVQ